jgi:hypothetical protein
MIPAPYSNFALIGVCLVLLLVYEWVGGRHACVDLIVVSPFVELMTEGFTAG